MISLSDGNDMTEDFIPVMPPTPPQGKNPLWVLRNARKNLLTAWSKSGFRMHSQMYRLLNQKYFLCNSPDIVKRVFLDEHDNYDRKSPQMINALEPLLGDGLFVSAGELWKERRAACFPLFDSALLPGFAEVMSDSATELADRWAKLPQDSEIDVLNEMAKLTARIIGRTVFGDDVPETEAAQVVNGFSDYQRAIQAMELSDALGVPFLRHFGHPLRQRRTQKAAKRVHQVVDRIIESYKIQPDRDRLTLLAALLKGETGVSGSEKRCPLSDDAARNEAIVMFMAGHETTANSLTWTWYLLDGCPSARDKLHQELDEVLQGRAPTYADVPKLVYTRAVFEEALRLYPPVPILSRQARYTDEIHGHKIDPGTIMLVVPWLLQRHEKLWDAPNAFRPERFLPDQPKPDKFAYIPFSVGRRVCLGLRFGLTEGILCLATLAQRFQLNLRPNHSVETECRLTLKPENGLPMTLQARQ